MTAAPEGAAAVGAVGAVLRAWAETKVVVRAAAQVVVKMEAVALQDAVVLVASSVAEVRGE